MSKVEFAIRAAVCCVPETDLVPLQPPDAVHEVASVADHCKVAVCPLVTEAGAAVNVTTGGATASATFMPNVP